MPAAAPEQTASADQAQIDQGKGIFAQKCSHCHGPNMVNSGTVAPDLRRFPDDKTRFFTTVKLGKNGRMPPWGDLLSDDQIAGSVGLYIEPEKSMRTWLATPFGAAAALIAASPPAAPPSEVLKVCLDEDLPPLSVHHRGKPDSGFDVALAQARSPSGSAGRSKIQWFESKLDEDSSPALEANALLSDGRCSLVGSYALTRDSLVVPGVKTAKLPDFDGATRDDRRGAACRSACSRQASPIIYSPLTIVLGPPGDRKGARAAASPASATLPDCASASKAGRLPTLS